MRDASSVRCQDPHPNPPRNPLFQCTPSEFWEIGQTGRYSPVSETDHLKRKIILFSKNPITYGCTLFCILRFLPQMDIILPRILHFLPVWNPVRSRPVFSYKGMRGLSQRYFECSSPSTSLFKHPDWFKKGWVGWPTIPLGLYWPFQDFWRLLRSGAVMDV